MCVLSNLQVLHTSGVQNEKNVDIYFRHYEEIKLQFKS